MTTWATSGARAPLMVGAGAVACALLALIPGDAGPLGARAGLAALAMGAVAAWVGRRRGGRPAAALRITSQAALGRDGTVAVVEVDGRRFLIGAGAGAPELLIELAPSAAERSP